MSIAGETSQGFGALQYWGLSPPVPLELPPGGTPRAPASHAKPRGSSSSACRTSGTSSSASPTCSAGTARTCRSRQGPRADAQIVLYEDHPEVLARTMVSTIALCDIAAAAAHGMVAVAEAYARSLAEFWMNLMLSDAARRDARRWALLLRHLVMGEGFARVLRRAGLFPDFAPDDPRERYERALGDGLGALARSFDTERLLTQRARDDIDALAAAWASGTRSTQRDDLCGARSHQRPAHPRVPRLALRVAQGGGGVGLPHAPGAVRRAPRVRRRSHAARARTRSTAAAARRSCASTRCSRGHRAPKTSGRRRARARRARAARATSPCTTTRRSWRPRRGGASAVRTGVNVHAWYSSSRTLASSARSFCERVRLCASRRSSTRPPAGPRALVFGEKVQPTISDRSCARCDCWSFWSFCSRHCICRPYVSRSWGDGLPAPGARRAGLCLSADGGSLGELPAGALGCGARARGVVSRVLRFGEGGSDTASSS
eukprot:gnl/Chilomastix_cuspidata/4010.p1 GENE.gnl/Chilomastix_cuspidata/4010~~gnl/Chilomastix_cuspidata/4010.p1  ORF type:complete len:490 (+),score=91.16 gnl/Chilomastix_cuspidata/4010:555-2024(+)